MNKDYYTNLCATCNTNKVEHSCKWYNCRKKLCIRCFTRHTCEITQLTDEGYFHYEVYKVNYRGIYVKGHLRKNLKYIKMYGGWHHKDNQKISIKETRCGAILYDNYLQLHNTDKYYHVNLPNLFLNSGEKWILIDNTYRLNINNHRNNDTLFGVTSWMLTWDEQYKLEQSLFQEYVPVENYIPGFHSVHGRDNLGCYYGLEKDHWIKKGLIGIQHEPHEKSKYHQRLI